MAAPTPVYTAIDTGRTDAKSPLDDSIKVDEANNDAWAHSMMTDGSSAPEAMVTDTLELQGTTGIVLQVNGDADIVGNLTVGGFTNPNDVLTYINM